MKNNVRIYPLLFLSYILILFNGCIEPEDKPVIFTRPDSDVDGNIYKTIQIGNQLWMAENLKTTRFNDGTAVALVEDSITWSELSSPGYCWYNNDSVNKKTYGALYNWYAVNTEKLCPSGWHVPSDDEWTYLTDYLGGATIAGGKLKESGTTHWLKPYGENAIGSNETGFTALPGGAREDDWGMFGGMNWYAFYWSSTASQSPYYPEIHNAWLRILSYDEVFVTQFEDNQQGGMSVRCLRDFPTLTTQYVTQVNMTSAICGGEISDDYGYPVTGRGVCWSSLHTPTILDSLTTDGSGTGNFSSTVTGLIPNTKYSMAAYATNSIGTGYGREIIFTTKGISGQISDIEGNNYSTIQIGSQTWMAENLKTTRFNDNSSISLVPELKTWDTIQTPAYCWYNNDEAKYKKDYGALYNLYAVNTGKLCPSGWHVPGDSEWNVLREYLGGAINAGGKLKEAGTSHWFEPNAGATNESGFTARPGGIRSYQNYTNIGYYGYWWSSTQEHYWEANCWNLNYMYTHLVRDDRYDKRDGLSVRCLKDE